MPVKSKTHLGLKNPHGTVTIGVIIPHDLNDRLNLVADSYQKSKSTLVRQIVEHFFIQYQMPISTPFIHPLGAHYAPGSKIPLDWSKIDEARARREGKTIEESSIEVKANEVAL